MYDIERYLNIRSAYSPSIGPDGGLVFLMDTTGVPQVWRLDEPRSWPRQLTFTEEPVSFASWSRERPELVFGMDQGGNEREQLFRLTGDGESISPLTAMPDAKHRWGGWSHDGDRIAFTSNRRDEAVFDVYVQDRTAVGGEAVCIHEGDGWLTVGGWSPTDDRLIVHEAYSNFDMDVYVLTVEDGELT
ncbi:MAG: S9 family peptidase, partial [Halobacteriales archaeon]|nr:S9 family peptidase [Halobacteriales archaeon]